MLLQFETILRIYLVIVTAPGVIDSSTKASPGDSSDHFAAHPPDERDDCFILTAVLSGSGFA